MKKHFTEKLWKVMKICATQMMIAVIVCGVSAAHDNYAQLLERKVTLNLNDIPLVNALKEIEEVAEIKIYYSLEQLGFNESISIEAKEEPLRAVLDNLLSPHSIKYRVDEKKQAIFLKRETDSGEGNGTSLNITDNNSFKLMAYVLTGTITEAATQQPMAGVNVIVKGTTEGTTTDSQGKYSLQVSENDNLIFSFIGYKTIEAQVSGRTTIDVTMEEDISSLNEVVVYSTGYSEETPERTTGLYSSIGPELLERNVGPDLVSRLNGVTPSLLIDQRSGNQTFFSIRGRSTILANDQPLIVVDNFPYNGDLNTINPNDIENITVLRDAAAASIWGVRAGNGVIVITTKRGIRNRPIQVDINSNITIGEKPDLFYEKRMSTSDFIDTEHMLFDKGFYNSTINSARKLPVSPAVEILLSERNGIISEEQANQKLDALRNLDVRNELSKYFYRRSVNQQYAINLSGGSDKYSFYFSSGVDKNLLNQIGNEYSRVSLNVQQNFTPTKNLDVSTGLVFTTSKNLTDPTLSYIRMGSRKIYPYAKFTDEHGNHTPIIQDYRMGFPEEAESVGFLNWQFNPIEELGITENQNKLSNIRATAGITYTIIDGLSAQFKYQYEKQTLNSRLHQPLESYFTRDLINRFSSSTANTITRKIPEGDILTFGNNDLNSQNGRVQVNFSKTINTHSINALVGAEIREVESEGYSSRFYGYDPNLGSSVAVNYTNQYLLYPTSQFASIPSFNSVTGTVDRYRSYFTNASYIYNKRYSLSASARIDQSNLFGVRTNHRSAPLWSVGGKWSIDKESFYNINSLSVLRLRATYGFNGNIDERATAYTTAILVTGDFTGRNAARIRTPPNPDLRWEKSRMLNIGLDFVTKKEVVSGSIEYYNKRGIDLFGFGPLDPTTGLTTFKGNVANTVGYGWDIVINTKNIDRKTKWSTSFLFSYATDKVTQYESKPSSLGYYFNDGSLTRETSSFVPTVGKPLFALYSYRWAGLDPNTGDPRGYLNNEPSTNYSDIISAATVDSLVYHGRATPPIFGALRNTFTYSRWSLSINITYRLGYYFRRPSINYYSLFNNYESHTDYTNRWQTPGDESITNVPSMIYPANATRDSFYSASEVLVEKGDNLRLQDVQISYDLGNIVFKKVSLRQIQIYGYVSNIGILWKANRAGVDPDFPTMPLPRAYAFGVRIGI